MLLKDLSMMGVMALLCAACGTSPEASKKTSKGLPRVLVKTSRGDFTLELWPAQAPITVENFLTYVRDGYYPGTIFHRVIDGFMIQGGGLTAKMEDKEARSPIKNEAHNRLPNERGTIAMARTMDLHSATSQFFVNLENNDFLNHKGESPEQYGYTVFGRVVEGMDVVDLIAKSPTTLKRGHQDVPSESIEILEVQEL